MPLANNGNRIKKRFMREGTKVPKYKLNKDNSFLLFPFDITLGAINSTEAGLRTLDNTKVTDYSAFQRLYTGLENVIVEWDGAYNVKKDKPGDTFLTKEYVVGRSFSAYIPDESQKATFEPSSISADFLAEFTEESFNIHSYEDLEEEDLLKMYVIPELKEYKWLYVSDNKKYFLPNGEFHHIELTLTTLNNKIAKSGRATEEFIHRSAPGEGYAFPIVDSEQRVKLDTIRDRDIPVTSIQSEMAGPAGFSTIFAYGRPTVTETKDGVTKSIFNPRIEAPRLLLPFKIETPIPSPLNTRPSAETDFYVGKFKPTLEEYFGNWKKQLEASYNTEQKATFEGVLESVDTLAKLQESNPINQGSHQYNLWDPAWKINVNKVYNTSTDSYTDKALTLKGDYSLQEILAHNIFGTSGVSTLPLSVKQNISWSLSDIPLVGGFLSKITFGIPIGWRDEAVRVAIDDIIMVLPASLVEYGNVLQGRSPNDRFTKPQVDLLTFTAENTDDSISYSGINATGTILKVGLTDRFSKVIDGKTYVFNTLDLAQAHPLKDDNGIDIPNVVVAQKLLWDGTCKPVARKDTTPGYVIDATSFKALAKLDYRMTCFSNNTSVWAGTYQTNSKFTGSIRDWTNYIKMSNWKEDSGQQVDYPGAIVAPTPPNVQQPQFDFTVSDKDIETKYNLEVGREVWKLGQWGDNWGSVGGGKAGEYYEDIPNEDRAFGMNDSKEYVSENIVQVLDTTPYGGINNFKNNYKQLKLLLSERFRHTIKEQIKATQKGDSVSHITIDTATLVNQGEVTSSLFTKFYDEKRWIDDETLFISGKQMTNSKECEISIKLQTDNNNINIIAVSKYRTFRNDIFIHNSGVFNNQPNEHAGTDLVDVWFNVDQATAIPVVIVPNGGK